MQMHLENDHGENSQTEKEKDIEAHAIEVENAQKEKVQAEIQLLYTIDENPPWHLAVALGFQVCDATCCTVVICCCSDLLLPLLLGKPGFPKFANPWSFLCT